MKCLKTKHNKIKTFSHAYPSHTQKKLAESRKSLQGKQACMLFAAATFEDTARYVCHTTSPQMFN